MRKVILLAAAVFVALAALYVAPFVGAAAKVGFATPEEVAEAEDGHSHAHGGIVDAKLTATALVPVTIGSESGPSNRGRSLLKDSTYGNNTLQKACDTNRDGYNFQSNVYNVDGRRLDGIQDRNGADRGCGFQFYYRSKAQHQGVGIAGEGNCSIHRANEGGKNCDLLANSPGTQEYIDPEKAPPPNAAASASAAAE